MGRSQQGWWFTSMMAVSTASDNIVFRMADGQHQVEFLYPIAIAPDDQPLLLNANTGLVQSRP